MTLSIKQLILSHAIELQRQLEKAKPVVDNLSPSEQLSNANQFIPHSKLLTELQKKVEATYRRQQDAIPDITEEELLGIAEKLTACADILESLDKNNQIAEEYVDIASAVDKLYQSSTPPNASEVTSLQGRIQELTSAYSYMNKGNKEAPRITHHSLLSILTQSSAPCTTQTSGVRNSSPQQSPRTMISEDQKIQQPADEKQKIASFRDQFQEIRKTYTDDPKKEFSALFDHYEEVRKYALSKGLIGMSEITELEIAGHLEELEGLMNAIYTTTMKENEQAQQVQDQATQVEILNRSSNSK